MCTECGEPGHKAVFAPCITPEDVQRVRLGCPGARTGALSFAPTAGSRGIPGFQDFATPVGGSTFSELDPKNKRFSADMFITVLHGENEKALFNTHCKVQPLLESIKRCCGCEEGDEIELADEHGQVKNLLQHQEDYGWQLLRERELCVLLKVTRQEGSQEAVFTPLLKNQSIVTPKFLARLGKSEDSKESLTRGKTRKYGKKTNLLLESPSTAGKKSKPPRGRKNKTLGSTSKGTGKH